MSTNTEMQELVDEYHLERAIADARVALALLYGARLLRDARHVACGDFLAATAVEISRGIPAPSSSSFDEDADEFSTVANRTRVGGLWGKRANRLEIVVWPETRGIKP